MYHYSENVHKNFAIFYAKNIKSGEIFHLRCYNKASYISAGLTSVNPA